MSRFRFSLDRVLEIRASQERAAAAALASANASVAASGSSLDGLLEDLRSVREALSDGNIDPAMANSLQSGLRIGIARAAQERERRLAEASRCRTAWQESRRQKELLEKLRETRLGEFRAAEQRSSDSSLDEWAVQRHVRQ